MKMVSIEGNTTKLVGLDFMITMVDLYPKDDEKIYSYVYVDAYRTPNVKLISEVEYEQELLKFNQYE